jgi:hypothetical protein
MSNRSESPQTRTDVSAGQGIDRAARNPLDLTKLGVEGHLGTRRKTRFVEVGPSGVPFRPGVRSQVLVGGTGTVRSRRAGTSARERSGTSLRKHHRQARPAFIGLVATAGIVLLSVELVFQLVFWSLLAGLLAGVLLAFAIVLRYEPLEVLMSWAGAPDAKTETENALKPLLLEGWQDWRGMELEPAGYSDDVLIGPSGIAYVIETRALPGRVSLERGVLTQRFGEDPFAVSRHDLRPRPELRGRVAEAWIRRRRAPAPAMRSIVVIWGEFENEIVEHQDVLYVAGADLLNSLRSMELKPPPTWA